MGKNETEKRRSRRDAPLATAKAGWMETANKREGTRMPERHDWVLFIRVS
jgi:hypothetical protein